MTEQTTFNISEVARLTGKARSTITNHIRKGKLSFIHDAQNNKLIEASEIIRVYSDHLELDADGKLKSKTKRSEKKGDGDSQDAVHYRELFEREKSERDRERQQFRETIEHLRGDLDKSQTRESKATFLLEHQSKETSRFAEQMAEIQSLVSNQQDEARKYRRALMAERNKTLWQKLFG